MRTGWALAARSHEDPSSLAVWIQHTMSLLALELTERSNWISVCEKRWEYQKQSTAEHHRSTQCGGMGTEMACIVGHLRASLSASRPECASHSTVTLDFTFHFVEPFLSKNTLWCNNSVLLSLSIPRLSGRMSFFVDNVLIYTETVKVNICAGDDPWMQHLLLVSKCHSSLLVCVILSRIVEKSVLSRLSWQLDKPFNSEAGSGSHSRFTHFFSPFA